MNITKSTPRVKELTDLLISTQLEAGASRAAATAFALNYYENFVIQMADNSSNVLATIETRIKLSKKIGSGSGWQQFARNKIAQAAGTQQPSKKEVTG